MSKVKQNIKNIIKNKKKGFSLIELIVVIAVLGILTLLAAPKFVGYTAAAHDKKVMNDIRVYEDYMALRIINGDNKITDSWDKVDKATMEKYRDEGTLYNIKGVIEKDYEFNPNQEFIDIPEDDLKSQVKSKLDGNFIMSESGQVFYQSETSPYSGINNNYQGPTNYVPEKPVVQKPVVKDSDGDGFSDELEIKLGKDPNNPNDFPDATPESDFEWVKNNNGYYTAENPTVLGFYRYKGSDSVVIIPEEINGTELTSYAFMFGNQTSGTLEKVISKNKKITNTSLLFSNSKVASIDLSEFDTSNVTNMTSMFQRVSLANSNEIDVSYLDTSNVTLMTNMFSNTRNGLAYSLKGLEHFDTSKVTNMSGMFQSTNITNLDVSNFKTSEVTDMSSMFASFKGANIKGIENFKTSKVTNMYSMFSVTNLDYLDLSGFDMSNVTNKNYMFYQSAIKEAYVKDENQLNLLNATTGKSINVTFEVK